MSVRKGIALVGDSDIARWPMQLLPFVPSTEEASDNDITNGEVVASGYSGATLNQVIPKVEETISKLLDSYDSTAALFVIVCAGENDVCSGIELSSSQQSFQQLVNLFYQTNRKIFKRNNDNYALLHLIFLGPKFEPWLTYDDISRKSYLQMSLTFERLCKCSNENTMILPSHSDSGVDSHFIHYIDCLTMFCGTTAHQPGAIYGGKAIPDTQFFNSDQLHLSEEGYKIWKSVVEDRISKVLQSTC
jgi:lysophospholipase L1-like esterase